MNILPAVIHVEYRGEFRTGLVLDDGVEGTIDFSNRLSGPVFESLKDPRDSHTSFLRVARSPDPTVSTLRLNAAQASQGQRGRLTFHPAESLCGPQLARPER
jgi:hypothetical protein